VAMYAEERQQEILNLARTTGRVDVTALAKALNVTTETIRRDLDRLVRQGLLTRVHGGAIPHNRIDFEPELSKRDVMAPAEKARIARAALTLLPRTGTVLIDGGTTTARLAATIPDDSELTFATNAWPIASLLSSRPGVTVHLIGGRIRTRTMAAVDAWALDAIASINVDMAFLGTNGVSVKRGLTTPDASECAIKAAMIEASRKVAILADSTKFDNNHFARFARLRDVDVIVSDAGLPEAAQEAIIDAGPDVLIG
jgi:DeoR family fructose operon transcriptional repressor